MIGRMKVAILSDVHSNLPALLAVAEDIGRWEPDRVVVAGDLVNRGPRPVECLELVQRQPGWELVLGNHEEYVLEQARPDAPRSGPRFELQQPSFWTLEQLDGRAAGFAELPPVWELDGPDGRPVRVYHASPLGMRVGIRPETSDDEVRALIAPAPVDQLIQRLIDQQLIHAGLPIQGVGPFTCPHTAGRLPGSALHTRPVDGARDGDPGVGGEGEPPSGIKAAQGAPETNPPGLQSLLVAQVATPMAPDVGVNQTLVLSERLIHAYRLLGTAPSRFG